MLRLKKEYDLNDVDAAREYVQEMPRLLLYLHHLYESIERAENTAKNGWANTNIRIS